MYTKNVKPDSNNLDDLENVLRSFFQLMKRPQRWGRITAQAGVTIDRPAGAIIHLLLTHATEQFRLQDIAVALGIEAPSVTRKTQALERAGYLARLPDPKDGRAVSFYLTPAGIRLGQSLHAAQREFLERSMRSWSNDDIQQLVTLLERFSIDLSRSYESNEQTKENFNV